MLFPLLALFASSHAFSVGPLSRPATARSVSTTPLMDMPSTLGAKDDLLMVCRRLKSENGVFIVDKASKDELFAAVEQLESLSEPPLAAEFTSNIVGEWTLMCTTSTTGPSIDKSKLPSFITEGPLADLRQKIQANANRSVKVQQICKLGEDGKLDRVDHVIEYSPPKKLQDIFDNLPEQLTGVDINPLDVSKSKFSLIHKAEVDADERKMKLSLKSVVLNVAGTSTVLDPNGADLVGINVPLGEFLSSAEFETTYMDNTLRVSRGKQGFVDVLRVFVREDEEVTVAPVEIVDTDETVNSQDEGLDVDEAADPEFKAEDDHEGKDDVSPSDY